MTEVDVTAGRREVTTTYQGYAARYHVWVPDAHGNGIAACRPWVFLSEDTQTPVAQVPEILRCRLPACKRLWPPSGL